MRTINTVHDCEEGLPSSLNPLHILSLLLVLMFYTLFSAEVSAHEPGLSKMDITFNDRQITLESTFALSDIKQIMGINTAPDIALTAQALSEQQSELTDQFNQAMVLKLDGQRLMIEKIQMSPDKQDGLRLTAMINGAYGTQFSMEAKMLEQFAIGYRQFVTIRNNQGLLTSAILSAHNPMLRVDLPAPKTIDLMVNFFTEGIWHIWIGYDHIVFLISLLLPVAWLKTGSQGQICNQRTVFKQTLIIVSAFTIAHSITLALTIFGVISLPSTWVESMIALSVILAALNNVFMWVNSRLWLLAGSFGLIHGMGFASVLSDLGLSNDIKIRALFAFNLGVEFGQICIVILVLPLIYYLSQRRFYQPLILNGGSWCIALLASVWLLQRAA